MKIPMAFGDTAICREGISGAPQFGKRATEHSVGQGRLRGAWFTANANVLLGSREHTDLPERGRPATGRGANSPG